MAEADLSAVPWVDRMVDEMRSANPKAARFPYTELRYEFRSLNYLESAR